MVDAGSIRRSRGLLGFARRTLVVLAIAVLTSFLVRTFVIRDFFIPSASMSDTLTVGDHILVSRLTPWLVPVSRGDVVVFRDPGGWTGPRTGDGASADRAWAGRDGGAGPDRRSGLAPLLEILGESDESGTRFVVKRVIGVGGDRVACCDALGRVSVNGAALDEPYVRTVHGDGSASREDFEVTVAPGSVWVLGDNRHGSRDSRAHLAEPGRGSIPLDQLVGVAFVRSWPPARWALLPTFPEVFDRVEAGPGGARAGQHPRLGGRGLSGSAPDPLRSR